MSGFWTKDRIAYAAKLWNDGGSGSEIAVSFGVSRNSVIGIVHRNRALFKAKPKRGSTPARLPKPDRAFRPKSVKQAPGSRAPRPAAPMVAPHEMFEPAAPDAPAIDREFAPIRPIPFLKVTDDTCRWPLWLLTDNPGAEGLCCGDPTDGTSSWCSHHRRRARAA